MATMPTAKVIYPFCGKRWTAQISNPGCCIGFGRISIDDGDIGIKLGSGWLFPCQKCMSALSDYIMEKAADRRDGKERR